MKFTPTINPNIKDILRIELKIEPRTTVRNDTGRVKEFFAHMGLPLIVFEEYPGRAMKLAYDYALGPADHKGPVLGH